MTNTLPEPSANVTAVVEFFLADIVNDNVVGVVRTY
jgi:hypothetical protein